MMSDFKNYELDEIEEIAQTLLVYDSNLLYFSLGIAVMTENFFDLIDTSQLIAHQKEKSREIFIEKGKSTINELTTCFKSKGGDTDSVVSDSRKYIRKNMLLIIKCCNFCGYQNDSIYFLSLAMICRRL